MWLLLLLLFDCWASPQRPRWGREREEGGNRWRARGEKEEGKERERDRERGGVALWKKKRKEEDEETPPKEEEEQTGQRGRRSRSKETPISASIQPKRGQRSARGRGGTKVRCLCPFEIGAAIFVGRLE